MVGLEGLQVTGWGAICESGSHVPAVSLFLDHECADVAAVLALVLASGFQAKPVRNVLRAALRADKGRACKALL